MSAPTYSQLPEYQACVQPQPNSKLELSLRCQNLKNMDILSLSDPLVVLFMKERSEWCEIGRTEIIWDNLNPEFTKKFVLDYYFEEIQYIKFQVYDVDAQSSDLSKHDFLGEIELTLVEAAQGQIRRDLQPRNYKSNGIVNGSANQRKSNLGQIIINAEEIDQTLPSTLFRIKISAENVDKQTGLFSGISNVFLQVAKATDNGLDWIPVYRTTPIKSTNPTYPAFLLESDLLSNGRDDRPLRLSIVHNCRNGTLRDVHHFKTTQKELRGETGRGTVMCLTDEDTRGKDSPTRLHLTTDAQVRPSFMSLLRDGLELNFHVAIDFTASNGDPRQSHSLHYINPRQMNSYECAIQSIGSVLEQYDADRRYPVYGFGAKLFNPTAQRYSTYPEHDFALNGNPEFPEVSGVSGILDVYRSSLSTVQFHGPTNFSPIIRRVSGNLSVDSKLYTVLLIITDGQISDMENTMDAIVEAADLPLSIVIVGVGQANFSNMQILDGDDVRLVSPRTGKRASRDIVQFVALNKFIKHHANACEYGMTLEGARDIGKFCQEVLHEIPGQVSEFFTEGDALKAEAEVKGGQWASSSGDGWAVKKVIKLMILFLVLRIVFSVLFNSESG